MGKIIITSPSLDSEKNIGGISAITSLIIMNNIRYDYIHFELGKRDHEERTINYYLRVLRAWITWCRKILSERDTLVHFNISLEKRSLLRDLPLVLFARLLRRKIIIHIHGGLYLNNLNIPFWIRFMIRMLLSGKAPKIVLSETERQNLIERYDISNVHVLPNTPDLSDAMLFRRDFVDDTPLILYLGRIVKDKGIEYIFKSLKILKEKGVKFRFLMAGAGPDRSEYIDRFTEILGDDFTYRGVVSGLVKTQLLRECDIFLLPSFYEGLPVSLLEAMSFAEVPVVTGVGSIGKIVKHGENGFVIRPRNEDDIVEAMVKLINDKRLRKQMAENAQRTVLENFNSETYISELNKIYSLV